MARKELTASPPLPTLTAYRFLRSFLSAPLTPVPVPLPVPQDHITVARQDLKELNRWKAASVRSEGWTEEVGGRVLGWGRS